MEAIIFFIALFCVIYVLIWAIQNEDVGDDEPTQGFFRMTDEQRESEESDGSGDPEEN